MAEMMQITFQLHFNKGEDKNIKFPPTLCKHFTFAHFDISCSIYEQYFYTNIGRNSPRLGGYRDRCMFNVNPMCSIMQYIVFRSNIDSAKHCKICQHLFGLSKLQRSK